MIVSIRPSRKQAAIEKQMGSCFVFFGRLLTTYSFHVNIPVDHSYTAVLILCHKVIHVKKWNRLDRSKIRVKKFWVSIFYQSTKMTES